uniref:20.6 kDa protein n=1 Tax=Autographa californica nuclear polyhedrosis virus TaxID=46015 RepID=Q64803_NPVAC|nr:20.6 kDa protein [Autographa californica nucleopolyhedrovirus]
MDTLSGTLRSHLYFLKPSACSCNDTSATCEVSITCMLTPRLSQSKVACGSRSLKVSTSLFKTAPVLNSASNIFSSDSNCSCSLIQLILRRRCELLFNRACMFAIVQALSIFHYRIVAHQQAGHHVELAAVLRQVGPAAHPMQTFRHSVAYERLILCPLIEASAFDFFVSSVACFNKFFENIVGCIIK